MSFDSSSSLFEGLRASLLLRCSKSSISTLIWLSKGEIDKNYIFSSSFLGLEGSGDSPLELEANS